MLHACSKDFIHKVFSIVTNFYHIRSKAILAQSSGNSMRGISLLSKPGLLASTTLPYLRKLYGRKQGRTYIFGQDKLRCLPLR